MSFKKYINILLFITIITAAVFSSDGMGKQRWGMFIGANKGGYGYQDLIYADDDAISIAATMSEIGGLPKSNASILLDPEPSDIEKEILSFKEKMSMGSSSEKNEFIFYYSGHSDNNGLLLNGKVMTYSEIKKLLESVDFDVTVAILDSCNSGAFTRAKGGVHRAPFLIDSSVSSEGHAFITSSSADEISQESDIIGGSFFTHFLVAGLRGAADSNSDGRITLNEVYDHTYNQTLNSTIETGGVQHPTYEIDLSGSGDLVMTDINKPSSMLLLDKTIDGQVFIRNGKGDLVIEKEKNIGTATPIALPAGKYIIQVVQHAGLMKSSEIELKRNKSVTVSSSDLTPSSLNYGRTRGSESDNSNLSDEELIASKDDYFIRLESKHGIILISETGIDFIENRSDEETESVSPDYEETDSKYVSVFVENTEFFNDKDMKYVPFALTVFPGLSTQNLDNKLVLFELSFIGAAEYLSGMQFNSIGSNISGRANGIQASGLYSLSSNQFGGIQTAGFYSRTSGDFNGIQASGIASRTTGNLTGIQSNGIYSQTKRDLRGIQTSGIIGVVNGEMAGFQRSGIISIAGSLKGVQSSGIMNICEGDAIGVQVGFINMAESLKGVPVGLINLYRDGITNIGFWQEQYDDKKFFYSITTGNHWFYNHFFIGGKNFEIWEEPESIEMGVGLGVRTKFLSFLHLDTDINVKWDTVVDTSAFDIDWKKEVDNYDQTTEEFQMESIERILYNFCHDNWGEHMNILGRAVLTTDWKIQPYFGGTAEVKKASELSNREYVYIPANDYWNGYGVDFNIIAGIRMDFF